MTMDMTLLPAPAVIEPLDFESIYQDRLAKFQTLYPDFTLVLESDPIVKLLEVIAYQELILRQRINDAARATMLAYALGTDLDNLAANYQVERLLITPADTTATPPVAAIYESDDRLRERTQSALEGLTTAGSRESYRFHAISASALVADVGVDSPTTDGSVRITVLADTASGMPDADLLHTVLQALSAETIRPLNDLVTVQAPEMIDVEIHATLYRKNDAASAIAAATGRTALNAWLLKIRRLGVGLARSGIDAALHQPSIDRVVLTSPPADILCTRTQCVRVTGITLSEVVSNE